MLPITSLVITSDTGTSGLATTDLFLNGEFVWKETHSRIMKSLLKKSIPGFQTGLTFLQDGFGKDSTTL